MIKTKIDEDILFSEETPIYHKALMLGEYTKDLMNGKRIGRLGRKYKTANENNLVLISFYQEFFNYVVTVFKYNEKRNELSPISFKVFRDWDALKEFVSGIEMKYDKDFYQYEVIETGKESIFEDIII